MRKFYLLATAIVAVVAFGALMVSVAFASNEALWLLNGEHIEGATQVPVEINAELLLEDMKPPLGAAPDMLCTGAFFGWVGANGEDAIDLILGLEGEDITETKPGKIKCVYDVKGACEGSAVEVEPLHLPWVTELMLVTVGGVSDYINLILKHEGGGEPGYLVLCKTFLGTLEDECTGETGALAANETGGVLNEFSENTEITAPDNCSVGGAGQALLVGSGIIKPTIAGDVLTVSEP